MTNEGPSKTKRIRGSEPTLTAAGAPPRKRRARGDEPTLAAPVTTVLYRVVDAAELARLQERGHRQFAPIEGAETMQFLCDESQARLVAGPGWVTRFAIRNDVLAKYPRTGSPPREEVRIPSSELATLNDAIIGPIVVLR
jgi:hypothetical protein